MLGTVLTLLSSAASALASWLGIKKTQQDQGAGVVIEQASVEKETIDVQASELAASTASAGNDPVVELRDGSF